MTGPAGAVGAGVEATAVEVATFVGAAGGVATEGASVEREGWLARRVPSVFSGSVGAVDAAIVLVLAAGRWMMMVTGAGAGAVTTGAMLGVLAAR